MPDQIFDSDSQRFGNAMSDTLRDLNGLADSFGRAMTRAFRQSALEGRRLEDVLKRIALSLSRRALDAALAPISRGIGQAVSGLFGQLLGVRSFAAGGVLQAGRAVPFAAGGVIAAPSYFPMRAGLGLAGEAGPEAVLPLARGSDGRLGVRAGGEAARPVQVTFNVTTPDAESFRKSEANVTAMLARAVARGQRGL